MRQSVMEYREAIHRMFKGLITPAELRARGLPPFIGRRVMQRQRQDSLEFEAGAPRPHDGAEALTAAQE